MYFFVSASFWASYCLLKLSIQAKHPLQYIQTVCEHLHCLLYFDVFAYKNKAFSTLSFDAIPLLKYISLDTYMERGVRYLGVLGLLTQKKLMVH